MNLRGGNALFLQVPKHDCSSNTEVRMVQIPLVIRTIAQSSSGILALQNEVNQSLSVQRDMVYSLLIIIVVENTQHHHSRQ